MKIELKRYGHHKDSTGGLLFVNGNFFGHTCEDEKREVKVYGETCIPCGEYEIVLRNDGGMNKKYLYRYDFHRGMLHLLNVPDFEWIYIHPLTNEKQTDGCIGVGYTALSKGGFEISRSVEAYTDLYQLVLLAIDRGEKITISVNEI